MGSGGGGRRQWRLRRHVASLLSTRPFTLPLPGLQVLDRVLAKAGGRRWWGTLGGRVKAQRAYRLAARGDTTKVGPRLEAAQTDACLHCNVLSSQHSILIYQGACAPRSCCF